MRDVADTPSFIDHLHGPAPQAANIGALFAAFAGWIPVFIAIIPAVYYAILIWESKTVQGWVQKYRARKSNGQ